MAVKEKATGFFGEFKTFIARGNVLDMAVGVIIGGAFGKISTSLVNDVIMPGGPPVIAQVLAGLEDGRVTREEMCVAVENLLSFVMRSPSCQ